MSRKSGKIAALIAELQGRDLDAHYLAYFECFSRQLFYEAHDVLEELWLLQRQGANGAFYKGLIQFAGAFVHLQKDRLRPAVALFKLAQANLGKYPPVHERLDLEAVLRMIELWLRKLEAANFAGNPLSAAAAPDLRLREP